MFLCLSLQVNRMLSNSSKDVEVNKTKDEQVFGDKPCISYLIDPKTVEVSLSSRGGRSTSLDASFARCFAIF